MVLIQKMPMATHQKKPIVPVEAMYNPKVVAHSVQDAALGDGEGCLSVDRNVPGYGVPAMPV